MRFYVFLLLFFFGLIVRAQSISHHDFVPELTDSDVALLIDSQGSSLSSILYQGVEMQTGANPIEYDATVATTRIEISENQQTETLPVYRPDRLTNIHTSTGYYEVFSPSPAPYKRIESFDSVHLASDGTPVLTVASIEPRIEPVLSLDARASEARPRDKFFGSVMLNFSNSQRVAVPSIGPEARILYARTEPSIDLFWETDSARNFFVKTRSQNITWVRMTFVMDIPRNFFNMPIPSSRAGDQVGLILPMPSSVRNDALKFAHELNLDSSDSLMHVLSVLVNYFRDFSEDEAPIQDTRNIYLDLARGKVGLCRHRAYAFMITAMALGIPTHFLQNEAHAWVEVRLGEEGWMRIDLGGSSNSVPGYGLEDRVFYQPSYPDPFAQIGSQPSFTPAVSARTEVSSRAGAASQGSLFIEMETNNFQVLRGRQLELHGNVRSESRQSVANIKVSIEAVLEGHSHQLGEAQSNEAGYFQTTLSIPSDFPLGNYQLMIRPKHE